MTPFFIMMQMSQAFPTNVAAVEGDGGGYAVLGWDEGDLSTVDRFDIFCSS